jgi:hypothetical protein
MFLYYVFAEVDAVFFMECGSVRHRGMFIK